MSISQRDEKDDKIGKGEGEGGGDESKKKFIRIWRVEASKEFILLAMILVALLSVSLYNPYQLLQITEKNLANTDRIIYNADTRYGNLSMFINASEVERKALGVDVINILLLYQIEQSHKLDLLLDTANISHEQYNLVEHDTTYIYANMTDEAITEGMNYTGYTIPFPMTLENMVTR